MVCGSAISLLVVRRRYAQIEFQRGNELFRAVGQISYPIYYEKSTRDWSAIKPGPNWLDLFDYCEVIGQSRDAGNQGRSVPVIGNQREGTRAAL